MNNYQAAAAAAAQGFGPPASPHTTTTRTAAGFPNANSPGASCCFPFVFSFGKSASHRVLKKKLSPTNLWRFPLFANATPKANNKKSPRGGWKTGPSTGNHSFETNSAPISFAPSCLPLASWSENDSLRFVGTKLNRSQWAVNELH